MDYNPLTYVLFLFFFIIVTIIGFDYLIYNNIAANTIENSGVLHAVFIKTSVYSKFVNNELIFKIVSSLTIGGIFYIIPSKRKTKKVKKSIAIDVIILAFFTLFFYVGYLDFVGYDLLIYPIIIMIHYYMLYRVLVNYRKILNDQNILGVSSHGKSEHSFSFNIIHDKEDIEEQASKKEELVVNNPYQGIWLEGGAGSGKSASIVEKIHHNAITNNYSAFIYDFKGAPPTLGRSAYNYWLSSGQQQKFAILNFSLPWISQKVNPFDIKYFKSDLFIIEYADSLMKNLEKAWIEKTDFWAQNAVSYVQAVIRFLKIHSPNHCTIPHMVAIVLTDYEVVLEALASYDEIRPFIQPMIVAHEKNAEGQLSGQVSSSQLPITKLLNKELFWALNPSNEDYEANNIIDLDISNKENSTVFVCCNNPEIDIALSPVISIITSVVMKNINKKGNNKCLFSIDELPTVYIKNLDGLPATARSNKVSTFLSLQDNAQLDDDYGTKKAKRIISNMGNQFTGMTNNSSTADRVSKMLGKVKKVDLSYSTNKGVTSTSERLSETDVRKSRNITGQAIGHFTGKIAGGKPAFFSAQFENFEEVYENMDNYSNEELPINLPLDYIGDRENIDMELVEAYFDIKMNENFTTILNEAKEILAPFKEIVDEKRASK